MRVSNLARTSLATAVAAAGGAIGTSPDSDWYRSLDKPAWQPPAQVFPAVWTPLYASIAYAGARALDASAGAAQRRQLRRAFGIDLALNAGWTPLFFRARRPRLALAEIVALNVANVVLLRRAWQADRLAGAALLPYAAWTGFATGLNAAIALRNPGQGPERPPLGREVRGAPST
ncbi:tryptophan-rich sensory protein [Frankia sp. AgB1.9]|uniref:TspO/MBR family protein n=1 Tax=unclassified Frankia TaxID=2632575 RepID=UPI001933F477|nr:MULTISPECIES: TspO/MBR family protein [unclassified Frankia]MBL7486882.1 tryptophan-rich sensory protein [Frankia sp. AgW1.1]MBL7547231.1 tryptophan-rich sensory protein [Frankia sp. AgB1.9]MBL7623977.1 tryptophan-rich sensory protein [Frankia sp. AgB1.8]